MMYALTYKPVKSFLSTFALILLMAVSAVAQDPRSARMAFDEGNYFKSIELYGRLLSREPDQLEYNLNIGISYLRTHIDQRKALDYLTKAESQDKFPAEGYLHLAEAYTHHQRYDEALDYLRKYEAGGNVGKKNKADFERRRANYIAAQELLKYPVEVSFKNLGPKLNSPYPDYHPFINKNEDILIFTSRRKTKPGAQPEFDGYFPSNIYMSTKEKGEWTEAAKLSDRINTSYDEQAVGLTDSGDSLFFYVDHINSFGNIYLSINEKGVFGDPIPLRETVNTQYVESACSISRDGDVLIFSSDRPGGLGGLDIWMRRKLPTGEWAEPMNLGPEVNTPFDEDFPTLSGDGRTLYFSSNGHPGMGNFDLFFSSWDARENTWSKPQNLGHPINTSGNEKSISFNDYGDRAYVTALRPDGAGDLDIYELSYANTRESLPAIFLVSLPNVDIPDLESKPKITIKNEYDEAIGEYTANSITGSYVLALYPGKYFLYLDMPGHKPYNEMIVVNSAHVRQDKNLKTINLEK